MSCVWYECCEKYDSQCMWRVDLEGILQVDVPLICMCNQVMIHTINRSERERLDDVVIWRVLS